MKMKLGMAAIVGSALLCLAVPAVSQQSVTVSLTGIDKSTTVKVNYKVRYAGIYSGTTTLVGAKPGLVCDDIADNISVGSSWTAKAYKVSTLTEATISQLMFGGAHAGYANIGLSGYAELAYLVELMFNTTDSTKKGNISAAIWFITTANKNMPIPAAAKTLVADAVAYAKETKDDLTEYVDLWIYTPTTIPGHQETWGRVPEGGIALLYLLITGCVCFGAIRMNSKNAFGAEAA